MAQYPVLLAGQRITAALLASMLPLEQWKTANTDRAATTTFADDPDLTVSLEANATYRVEMYLHYAALDAARFKTMWNVPVNWTGLRSAIGPDQGQILSSTSSGGTGRWGVHNLSTACTYGTRDHATNQCVAIEEGVVTTIAAGTLALQWAQATSNATATRLGSGSYMRVKRLA
ncbi:hypothetical protein [Streptomyces sp. NRRL S-337]|uniref:hypothetical protein n=1 Tax=Streptomyces sp. NRRL S-337 TaxID=1463900 RepID=UPI000691EEAA|nr:hypothetical protein [Streptomyces sp. NRRL S-337]